VSPDAQGDRNTGSRVELNPDAVRRTLLIVDDHAGFRSFARALLQSEGYHVIGEASDGESALDAVQGLDPDVVLLDIALPGMDGIAVAELLARANPDRPRVVLTSSRDAASYRTRLATSPALGFIPKNDLSAAALDELVR
jgi:DNA-binding NarL/FixJ family response regulator